MGTFFVDAETDGLYGTFLSVAAVVLDENGEETDSFYGTLKDFSKSLIICSICYRTYEELRRDHLDKLFLGIIVSVTVHMRN